MSEEDSELTAEEVYAKTHALFHAVDSLVGAAMKMEPTIELCVFTGHLMAVHDVLRGLVDAGPPTHDPDEAAHPLEARPDEPKKAH